MNENIIANSCSGNSFIGNIKEVTYIDKSGRKLLHVYIATGCINMGDGWKKELLESVIDNE